MAHDLFNFITFDEGIERIKKALAQEGSDVTKLFSTIMTSKDPLAEKLRSSLAVDPAPPGFRKWQLPVYWENTGAQMFITVGDAGAQVGEHAHNEGHGIRFIVSGSIHYNKQELTAGDWMFIPQGASYSFEVGNMGAVMCYCYQCCCVPTIVA